MGGWREALLRSNQNDSDVGAAAVSVSSTTADVAWRRRIGGVASVVTTLVLVILTAYWPIRLSPATRRPISIATVVGRCAIRSGRACRGEGGAHRRRGCERGGVVAPLEGQRRQEGTCVTAALAVVDLLLVLLLLVLLERFGTVPICGGGRPAAVAVLFVFSCNVARITAAAAAAPAPATTVG